MLFRSLKRKGHMEHVVTSRVITKRTLMIGYVRLGFRRNCLRTSPSMIIYNAVKKQGIY
jgi:hypothetical protein